MNIHKPNRTILKGCCAVALLCAGIAMQLPAGEPGKPYKGSAEFERLKSLVGTWKGKADMGQGPTEMTVEYRLVAGGSAIEERIFPGTPKEMVTMYNAKEGNLALHITACSLIAPGCCCNHL